MVVVQGDDLGGSSYVFLLIAPTFLVGLETIYQKFNPLNYRRTQNDIDRNQNHSFPSGSRLLGGSNN
jgi:hypothetical protein